MIPAPALLEELKARIDLARGSASMLLLVVEEEQNLRETREIVSALLRSAALRIEEICAAGERESPADWARASQKAAADAYVAEIAPIGRLTARATGKLLNAQRQDLTKLAGPLLLFLSRSTEQALRQVAPDFLTWAAETYEAPRIKDLAALAAASGAALTRPKAEEPTTPPIRFLHLSDLHLRPGATKQYDQDRVLDGLLDRLRQDRAPSPLDLVFVTGDLAFSGSENEYEKVSAFLLEVLAATGVPKDKLFVVPGNHDADRSVGRWLLRTLDSDATATDFFVEPKSRTWHEHKFDAYRKYLAKVVGDDRAMGLKVGAEAVEVVEVRGERIAVASFNSAWFANDNADIEKLWLGEANVKLAGRHIQQLGDVSLAIALMHHPTSHLAEVERSGVEQHLERAFDIVLRGHLHKDKTRVIQSQRGGYLEVAAAAAYQGSNWPDGCFLGELRPKSRTVRLRPYAFGSGADPWVLDTKVFPDDEGDGYCHTFSLAERKKDPLGLREALAAEAPAIVQSLDRSARRELNRSLGVSGKNALAIEVETTRALQDSVNTADLWASLDSTGQLKLHGALATRLAEHLASSLDNPGDRIPRTDPHFLQKVLEAFVIYWGENGHLWLVELGAQDATYMLGLHAFLLRTVDGLVVIQPRFGRVSPDIFIGAHGEPPARRAIIEVVRWRGKTTFSEGLRRLDKYMDATGAAQGALAVYGAKETEIKLEHVKTPKGRDVLLLRL